MKNFDPQLGWINIVFWIIFSLAASIIIVSIVVSIWVAIEPELIGTWLGKIVASFREASGI